MGVCASDPGERYRRIAGLPTERNFAGSGQFRAEVVVSDAGNSALAGTA